MEMIKTQDLAFTYPGTEDQVNTRALRGVDVTIERGSFVVILGHNGSGKLTRAKIINAILLCRGHGHDGRVAPARNSQARGHGVPEP